MKDQLKDNQLSQCFVCGKIDNEIEDFSFHTKYIHNYWDYAYYIGYLKSTTYEDLVDYVDIYVKRIIDSNKVEWFPCYFTENNKNFPITSEIQKISIRFDKFEEKIENHVKGINNDLNNIYSRNNEYDNRFSKIEEMLNKLLSPQNG